MENQSSQDNQFSCDTRLSRQEFLKKLLAPSVAIGAAMYAAPKVVDKFILPAQAAPQTSLQPKSIKRGVGGPVPIRR